MKQTQQKGSKNDDKAWMKWAYVGIALLVAVAMVGSYFAPMFGNKQTAQVGNTAVIGYTIRGEDGRPLITTDQKLMESEYQKGNVILLTSGMEIPVGARVSGENVAVIPVVYPKITGFSGFGLLGFEVDAISAGLVGMRPGETKVVSFSYGTNDLAMNLSEEDANGIGLNFTETKVGDLVPLGFTTSPDIPLGNETGQTPALRFGKVTAMTSDSMVIAHRYGSAEVTLNGITG
ncbi:hypothetical protein [Methanoculleus sp. 7T]|jgi:hypothetical protein|uniref:hypothetical protein n=1 Tax=Methanoculleus sp. 7T TaxID=2937282 RepID=UPI0020BE3319|nr:hypothetical protein [Methanoculleus sp. 7T]MCK8518979.1 hypothetical protein [Methanoculleus sp. 7T]